LQDAFGAVAASVHQQTDLLRRVAAGDYAMTVPLRSPGDEMGESINRMIAAMNRFFNQIRQTAEDVKLGSMQIAQAAQNLAQGSTEQAASVEELSAAISNMNEETKRSSDHAKQAADLATGIQTAATVGKGHMEEMNGAMQEITEASNSIKSVIKTIDDIAFQTNILELNAAVEAARAGEAGKGFSVVAEEVRNLATKSAEAAKQSAEMIERSINKVLDGDRIVLSTSASLEDISTRIDNAAELFQEIAQTAALQASSIREISETVESFTQVVTSSAASSEECAASAQSLDSQVVSLNESMSQFKLAKNPPARDSAG
jgi:methyl-accepting chemotaxis protein